MRAGSRRRRSLPVVAFWACCLCALVASPAPAAGDDPTGRGLQLLQAREGALASQAAQATETARRRGRTLYRLLLHEAAERRSGAPGPASSSVGSGPDAQAPGGRAIALGAAVLARDLEEAAALRDELARVRGERRTALAAAEVTARAGDGDAPVKLRPPVVGPITAPWGVARDEATGAWLFRSAAGYTPAAGAPVVAPADGRVARVDDDVVGGGRALVLVHAGGLTTVLAGLNTVTVAARDVIRAGAVVGTAGPAVRFEVSRGRTAVDPASLIMTPTGRTKAGPRSAVR